MNKRLVLLISLFAFIVLVVILSSAVFSLKQVEVNFLSTTSNLSNEEADIISSGNFDYGSSVFFLDKDLYTQNLEEANPYLKVASLEVIFPNRLIIHAIERSEVYAFKLSDNTYAITDEQLKVLSIKPVFVNTNENAILVNLTAQEIDASSAEIGKVLPTTQNTIDSLNNFMNYSKEWESNLLFLKGNIEEVTLYYEQVTDLSIKMRQGVNIVISNYSESLSDKLQYAYSVYSSDIAYRTKGIILVYKEEAGNIVAVYDDGE